MTDATTARRMTYAPGEIEITSGPPDSLPADDTNLAGAISGHLDLAAGVTVDPAAMKPPGIPVPDDPAAISMFTAHRVNSILHQVAHATERMKAAQAAAGDLRKYHVTHIAEHLQRALDSAHEMTDNLREHYPAEAAELEQVKQTIGLAYDPAEARGHAGEWVEMFHGTKTLERAASIKEHGLTAEKYGDYKVLTRRKDEAGYFAGAHGAVVTVRVPADKVDEYTEISPQGLAGLKKKLPPSMISKVESIDTGTELATISGQLLDLAKAVSPTAKAVTAAHLTETTLHELTHAALHAQAMGNDDPGGAEWTFNADHCQSHLAGAVEHAGKLWEHYHDNYPAESRWLTGIAQITHPEEAQQHADETISGQLLLLAFDEASHPRDPLTGRFIGGALAGRSEASVKAHDTASLHAKEKLAADRADRETEDAAPGPRQVTQDDLRALEQRLRQQIAEASKLADGVKHDQHEEHRAELAVELGSVAVGVALAFFTGGFSLALAGPFLGKQMSDHAPEIVQALARYHIVGRGLGRNWVSHPVVKSSAVARVVGGTVKSISRQISTKVPGLPSFPPPPVTLAAAPLTISAPQDPATAAASAVRYLTSILTEAGMDPQEAQDFSVTALKTWVAKNWDVLSAAGINPETVMTAPGMTTRAEQADAGGQPAGLATQLAGTISGQLDLAMSAEAREKAHQTAHDTASATARRDMRLRDAHGRWAKSGTDVKAQSRVYNDIPETRGTPRGKSTYESGGGTGRSADDQARLDAFRRQRETEVIKPIGEEGARGNSRPVTPAEFQSIAAEGRTRLHAIQDAPWSVHGLFQHWDAIKARAYTEARKPWGGATVDPRTGDDLPQGADKYAMSVKPTGLATTSIDEHASPAEFNRAMDTALSKYRKQLAKGGSYLGIFHDDDLGRIDIDPVTVLDTQDDVETIGAYTHAIGGAYKFSDGQGYWPPHVPSQK